MSGRSRKKGHGGEHENAERWLLTYADMITLLVAFFIMLYAMSITNQQKFQQLALSVRSGFGSTLTMGAPTVFSTGGGINGIPSIVSSSTQIASDSTKAGQKSGAEAVDAARLDGAFGTIKKFIQSNNLQGKMQVVRTERGVIITVMTDHMLFARGEADLRPEELGLLNKLAEVINKLPNSIRVEGHTDNLPIHTQRFASNWDLSGSRAASVVRYFESRNVASDRLELAGYADQHPIVPNTSEANRARNRRVEIAVLKLGSETYVGPTIPAAQPQVSIKPIVKINKPITDN